MQREMKIRILRSGSLTYNAGPIEKRSDTKYITLKVNELRERIVGSAGSGDAIIIPKSTLIESFRKV